MWSPLINVATVRKLFAAVAPPPARTVLIGTDHDLVTDEPELRVKDSNPLPAPFSSHFFQTWCGWYWDPAEYDSGDTSSVTAAYSETVFVPAPM